MVALLRKPNCTRGTSLLGSTAKRLPATGLCGGQGGVLATAVALGSEAADLDIDAGSVIMMVREVPVKFPVDFLKAVEAEREQRRPFVPVLISGSDGPRWVRGTEF
jgi:hypothetical protein